MQTNTYRRKHAHADDYSFINGNYNFVPHLLPCKYFATKHKHINNNNNNHHSTSFSFNYYFKFQCEPLHFVQNKLVFYLYGNYMYL